MGLLDNGGGVALYETNLYSLVTTLERHDSVSTLEWLHHNDNDLLLLAVGGLDGVASLYLVEMEGLESQGAAIVLPQSALGTMKLTLAL